MNSSLIMAGVGFEDNTIFTDDENVTIIERVENELGQSCQDCNVSLTLFYPNGSLHVVQNFNMTLVNVTGYYNATLFNATTLGTYNLLINATRQDSGGAIYNATSDRTHITVVDVYPIAESEWEMGLTLAFLASGFLFIYIFNRTESNEMKQLFFLLGLAMPMAQLGLLHNILRLDLGAGSLSSITGTMFRIYAGVFVFIMTYYLLVVMKNLFGWYLGGFKSRKSLRQE